MPIHSMATQALKYGLAELQSLSWFLPLEHTKMCFFKASTKCLALINEMAPWRLQKVLHSW